MLAFQKCLWPTSYELILTSKLFPPQILKIQHIKIFSCNLDNFPIMKAWQFQVSTAWSNHFIFVIVLRLSVSHLCIVVIWLRTSVCYMWLFIATLII
jgi:hypothetical protein